MKLFVGYSGERNARPVRLNVSALQRKWSDCTPALMVARPNETELHPVPTTLENGVLTWIPSHAETVTDGQGMAVVWMTNEGGDVLGKSETYTTEVTTSPSGGGEIPPEPIAPYVVAVLNAKAEFEATAARVHTELEQIDGKLAGYDAAIADADAKATEAAAEAAEAKTEAVAAGLTAQNALNRAEAASTAVASKAEQSALTAEVERATAAETALSNALTGKQNKLTAGANISIVGDVISSTGWGGGAYDDTEVRRLIGENADAIDEETDRAQKAESQLKNDLTDLDGRTSALESELVGVTASAQALSEVVG